MSRIKFSTLRESGLKIVWFSDVDDMGIDADRCCSVGFSSSLAVVVELDVDDDDDFLSSSSSSSSVMIDDLREKNTNTNRIE